MITITASEYSKFRGDYIGFCIACDCFTNDGVEPDATEYECENCGEHAVCGAEHALLEGLIDISSGDEKDEYPND